MRRAAALVINAILMAYSTKEIRFEKRYRTYYQILQFHPSETAALLAAYAGIKQNCVERAGVRMKIYSLMKTGQRHCTC